MNKFNKYNLHFPVVQSLSLIFFVRVRELSDGGVAFIVVAAKHYGTALSPGVTNGPVYPVQKEVYRKHLSSLGSFLLEPSKAKRTNHCAAAVT